MVIFSIFIAVKIKYIKRKVYLMFQNTFLFCNIGLYAAIIILINDYMRKSAMFWNPASGQKMNLHPGQQKYSRFPLRNKKSPTKQ